MRIAACSSARSSVFRSEQNATSIKVHETEQAVRDGADEIDMVINIGRAKEGDFVYVEKEIAAVVESCASRTVKVIIETCYLSDEEKVEACKAAASAGALSSRLRRIRDRWSYCRRRGFDAKKRTRGNGSQSQRRHPHARRSESDGRSGSEQNRRFGGKKIDSRRKRWRLRILK